MSRGDVIVDFLQFLREKAVELQVDGGWSLADLIYFSGKYEQEDERLIDADRLIEKLDDRIDEFIKKQPDKKNSEPVVMMQELIQLIERETSK